jgi:hypothetical protein
MKEKHVAICPREKASEVEESRSYITIHWTTEAKKECGRVLADPSNVVKGFEPLNTEKAKQMCIDRWGQVVLPTIEEIIEMIEEQALKYGWENIVLWKVDLHGAFHLTDIHPDDVALMAMKLRNGVLHHVLLNAWLYS